MNIKLILTNLCLAVSVVGVAQTVENDGVGQLESIAASPAELLRGELSGVRVSAVDGSPDGMLNVNIRGLNSLHGDSQPLWIVDGTVIGSSLNNNLDAFYLRGGQTINYELLPDYSNRSYTSPIGNFGWLDPYDIESIEVLKDVAATSLYGMQGANGVIIIKTKRPDSGEHNIRLNSNVGVDLSSQRGEAFKTGVLTTHNLGISGLFGAGSFYNISGFIRHRDAAVRNSRSTTGGVTINLETAASELFQFGLNSRLSYGNVNSASGTNYIGSPSAMMLARYPEAFPNDNISGWLSSFDDSLKDYRTVNSVWLNINFLKTLRLKLEGGLDYQTQNRYIWFGDRTSFGSEFNGAAGILNNSLLNYNFKAELRFDRTFAVRHHLQASLDFDINGKNNRTNAMCGTDFDLPYLKAKGMTSSGSIKSLRKFAKTYVLMGGYAFASYDYDGYAGVSGAARCDWTVKYEKQPLLFPSVQAFVDLKKIFLEDNQVLSALKLQGGYGMAGREVVLPYEYLYAYSDDIPEVPEAGAEPYFDGMNRLITSEYNVGLNVGFLNDRFNVSLKWYDKTTQDVFRIYNFGKILSELWVETKDWKLYKQTNTPIRNSGVELDADFGIIRSSEVLWNADVNLAYNINDSLEYDTLPKIYGGLGTSLSLYGFTVGADFSGAALFNIINANSLVSDNTLKPEDCLERGDYFRLDCLSLSYKVPCKARWIKDFKVNLSAHNLFTVTGYSGWNPDVNSFGVTAKSHGFDYGSYPLRRQVVLGVSFRF